MGRVAVAMVWLLRVAAGAVFMVSGAAKMIDPYGFIYKINDYLAVWHMDVAYGFVLMGSVLLSAVEFLTGFTLATGSMRRVSVWLASAMMAVMLPLTLWLAVANPVEDCGCFGDLWHISNWATFGKNVALVAALAFLWPRNRRVEGLFTPMSQWLQIAVACVWLVVIGVVGYFEQPLVDFRPYPAGEPLLREADASSIIYRYAAADGTVADFTADDLPSESDGGWTFVERIDPEEDVYESAFSVMDSEGNDVTLDVVGATDSQLLLLVPDVADAGLADTYTANELAHRITEDEGSADAFVAIVHSPDSATLAHWLDLAMADYAVYTAEDTAIKTVARGHMALVYLRGDTVVWKRTLTSVSPDDLDSPDFTFDSLDTDGPARFRRYTGMWIVAEMIVLMLGHEATLWRALIIRWSRLRRRRRDDAAASEPAEVTPEAAESAENGVSEA